MAGLVALLVAVAALATLVGVAASTTPGVGDLAARVRALGGSADPFDLRAVAPPMREAIVADEDERFYSHGGIDVIGLLRAIPYDIVHLSASQGASTITEQLAKLAYLGGNDHSLWRKVQDAALAVRIEGRYSKEEILAAYLNSAYFGEDATGISAAARRYFGTTPARLTLAQASLLAGLVQAPTADDPLRYPASARARQVETLRSMVRQGQITESEAGAVLRHPLPLAGGASLPALHDFNVDPGPPFHWGELVWGLLLVAVGVIDFLWARRRTGVVRALGIAVAVLVVLVGLGTAAASFRVA